MMKSAVVYSRKGKYYLRAEAKSSVGVLIEIGDPIVLPHDSTTFELGDSVRKILSESGGIVPHPSDPDSIAIPLLRAAGIKSWSVFQKGTLYCGIVLDGDVLKFRPAGNMGRGGFVPMQDIDVIAIPATSSNEEIGEALLKSISKSK